MVSLYPHQTETLNLLRRSTRTYVGDGMRVGKTPPVILASRQLGIPSDKILIHCPKPAVQVWEEAWVVWSPDTALPRIETYDKLIRNPLGRFDYAGYELYVPDEWHHCRHFSAARTRVSMEIANRTPRVWALSGTPMPNSPLDLYPALKAVWPDELRKLGIRREVDFMARFCDTRTVQHRGKYVEVVTGAKNVHVLQDILSRVMPLRRSLDDVAPWVPQLQWETHQLDMNGWEFPLSLIAQHLSERALDVLQRDELPEEDAGVAQARRELGTLKAKPAAELILSELANGDYQKIVVLAFHRDVLDILQRTFEAAHYDTVRVDGDTSDAERRCNVVDFQKNPEVRVFVGQLNTVKEALNLSAANHVVLVEQDWLPDNNRQAASRIVNITKEHPVYARMLFAPGSVDQHVRSALKRRMKMQGEIFNR